MKFYYNTLHFVTALCKTEGSRKQQVQLLSRCSCSALKSTVFELMKPLLNEIKLSLPNTANFCFFIYFTQ